MKLAVVGSRNIKIKNIGQFLPLDVTEIVCGGARGVDTCAAEYAKGNGIKLTVFLPEYEKYKRYAPLERNEKIIDYADSIIAFWDGKSRGTRFVIDECERKGKSITVIKAAECQD